MDKLPNDIIMRIIREADGGRPAHEKKFGLVMADLADLGENCMGWVYDPKDGETIIRDSTAEMFFDDLASGHISCLSSPESWRGGFVNNMGANEDSKFHRAEFGPERDGWFDFRHLAPYN
tara:strand:+ start:49 stop:408 length:360 start_codon:yes stop_codon:yes gene_type:complete